MLLLACLLLCGCMPGPVEEPVMPVQSIEPVSGIEFQSEDIQALQADPFANPGLLWVDQGNRAVASVTGAGQQGVRRLPSKH